MNVLFVMISVGSGEGQISEEVEDSYGQEQPSNCIEHKGTFIALYLHIEPNPTH